MEHPGRAYRLERLLAWNAGAEVWSATTVDDPPARVVVKRLRACTGAPSPHEVAGVVHDIAVSVDHPALLPLLDIVEEPSGLVLVVPYVAGGTLRDLLDERGVLGCGAVVAVLGPVADGLDALHEVGRVHGDVKPDNIVLTGRGMPVLADPAGPSGRWATPAYVAPEVANGGAVTPSADVHALAATAYELLAGRVLHAGDPASALAAARAGHHRPLTAHAVVDGRVAAVVEGALALRPGARPATAGAFLATLASLVAPAEVLLPGTAAGPVALGAQVPSARRRTVPVLAATPGPDGLSDARRSPLAWPPWPIRQRSRTKRCP